jgi:hypothetical protein
MKALKSKRTAAAVVLEVMFFGAVSWGQKAPPPSYPEQATVISSRILQAEDVNVSSVDAYSATEAVAGNNSVDAIVHTAYRLQTKTATYEITGWEAAKADKRPALLSGEVIHFRTQGNRVFFVLPDGKEHRYTVTLKHPTDSAKDKQVEIHK